MTYEAGWGKKLSYVIAFAWDHILGTSNYSFILLIIITYTKINIDVTKRYTRQWDELKQRRTLVDEETLANIIHKFNTDLGVNTSFVIPFPPLLIFSLFVFSLFFSFLFFFFIISEIIVASQSTTFELEDIGGASRVGKLSENLNSHITS